MIRANKENQKDLSEHQPIENQTKSLKNQEIKRFQSTSSSSSIGISQKRKNVTLDTQNSNKKPKVARKLFTNNLDEDFPNNSNLQQISTTIEKSNGMPMTSQIENESSNHSIPSGSPSKEFASQNKNQHLPHSTLKNAIGLAGK